ncbi:MAG: hypothetical protein IKQ23_10955 [Treponema sp.]|nr:hypothetical protein [Treponema sp.]MBR7080971.1 hypothetical protein [Treponema sp.]
MTREEIFKKNFPQYVTEKGVCLSPFWDLFDAGVEVATAELAKNYQTSRLYLEGYEDAKKELEKEIDELKVRLQRTEMLLTSAEITAHNEGADKIALLKEKKELEKACEETQELLDKQIEVTYKLVEENAELRKKNEEFQHEIQGLYLSL